MVALTPQERRAAQQAAAPLVNEETIRTDNQDLLYQQSMIAYVNAQDILFQNSMTTYVNAQNILFQNSMIDYVANQVAPKANKTYVDSQDTAYQASMTNYVGNQVATRLSKSGDSMGGNINFAAANQGPVLKAGDGGTWRVAVANSGALVTIAT